jgi:molybdenum cofactor cytidylyltransferase
MLSLTKALRLPRSPRLALVGAGGKTTLLFHLARLLPPPVFVTTTTHLGSSQAGLADRHILLTRPEEVDEALAVDLEGVVLLSGPQTGDERLGGLSPELFARVAAWASAYSGGEGLPVLVEADGSRLLPLKAPAGHEPAIPAEVEMVIVVAGLGGLGKPLGPAWVHRPERFAVLSGLEPGSPVTVEALGRVLGHPQGGLKNIPPEAGRALLLNGADTDELKAQAGRLASRLRGAYDSIVVASLSPAVNAGGGSAPGEPGIWAVHERAAGVILAAGAAHRYGQPKLLLNWRGEPLVRHVARTALEAGLDPVVLVAGAELEALRQAVAGLEVSLVHNPDWEAGQSASLRAGLGALPERCGSAVFLLADQPQISAQLVRALVEVHAETLPPLVAPLVDGKRGNPVLFDRELFAELLALSGDTGGRALFARYPVAWAPWHDPTPLLDIDTPEDYRRLLELE